MKINNIILVLYTRIILLSSFVIYFFCICHSGSFPIIYAILEKLGLVKEVHVLKIRLLLMACILSVFFVAQTEQGPR